LKEASKMTEAKVTKITMQPSRTINLGDYNSIKLDAGMEVSFDESVPIKGKEVEKAFAECLEVVGKQYRKQWNAFVKKMGKMPTREAAQAARGEGED